MDDEVQVRMRHDVADVLEQAETRVEIGVVGTAPVGDRGPRRRAPWPSTDDPSSLTPPSCRAADAVVGQTREDLPLGMEPPQLLARLATQQLEGDPLRESRTSARSAS